MASEYFQPLIEVVQPAGHTAEIHAEPDPTIIAARFVDVPVVAIESCVLEQELFDDSADPAMFRIGDKQFQPAGLLKKVTAVIRIRSPVSIDPRCLIVRLDRSTTIASRSTTVRIGMIDTMGTISSHKCGDQYLDVLQPYLTNAISVLPTYTIRVPIINNQLIQPAQMPLVDRIPTKDHYVLHYTISVPGRIWPGGRATTDFRIRTKIIQTLGFAEIISISDSFVDTPRLEEAWSNFKEWVRRACKCSHGQPTDQHSIETPPENPAAELTSDHEYYSKVLAQSGSAQPYSMPPPPVSTTGQNYYPYFPSQPVGGMPQPAMQSDDAYFPTQ